MSPVVAAAPAVPAVWGAVAQAGAGIAAALGLGAIASQAKPEDIRILMPGPFILAEYLQRTEDVTDSIDTAHARTIERTIAACKHCPPCIPPVGTKCLAETHWHNEEPGKTYHTGGGDLTHFPHLDPEGGHIHFKVMLQNSQTCKCDWKKRSAAGFDSQSDLASLLLKYIPCP